jgi:hypothetical protein
MVKLARLIVNSNRIISTIKNRKSKLPHILIPKSVPNTTQPGKFDYSKKNHIVWNEEYPIQDWTYILTRNGETRVIKGSEHNSEHFNKQYNEKMDCTLKILYYIDKISKT